MLEAEERLLRPTRGMTLRPDYTTAAANHQRRQVDDSYNYTAARVSSENYTICGFAPTAHVSEEAFRLPLTIRSAMRRRTCCFSLVFEAAGVSAAVRALSMSFKTCVVKF